MNQKIEFKHLEASELNSVQLPLSFYITLLYDRHCLSKCVLDLTYFCVFKGAVSIQEAVSLNLSFLKPET